MANKASNNLFQLIKSLSKSEKRYFKVFVKRHTSEKGKNNYEILFNYIEKQEHYCEKRLVSDLKGHALLNKLSIAKARLYDNILKALDAYYAEKSIDQKLRSELHYIEILFNKSLYVQCKKRVQSAKKQAIKYDKNLSLAQFINWERKLIEKDNYIHTSIPALEKMVNEEKELFHKLTSEAKLWEEKSILFKHINTKGRTRSNEEVNALKATIGTKLEQLLPNKEDYKQQYLYYHTKAAYCFAIHDVECSFQSLKNLISLVENHPNSFSERPNILFAELNNIIYLALQLNYSKEAQQYNTKLKALYISLLPEASDDLKIKLKSSYFSLQLAIVKTNPTMCLHHNIKEETVQFIEINKEKINEQRLAYLYYNLAAVDFINHQYNESLKKINTILNSINIDNAQEIYGFAQLLNLLIHTKLGNNELVNYMIKSTKRFLETRNKFFQFEKTVLTFTKKIANTEDEHDKQALYKDFADELILLKNNKFEQVAFQYLDIELWARQQANSVIAVRA